MVEYTTCPAHPDVVLPIAKREAERFLCYRCKQAERMEAYRRQKNDWIKQQKLGLRQRQQRYAITEGFTRQLDIPAQRVTATSK